MALTISGHELKHFVKHDLKGVLKCIRVKDDPPPCAPTDVTDITDMTDTLATLSASQTVTDIFN
jgi:hypothetical protein